MDTDYGPTGPFGKNPFETCISDDDADLDALAESALDKYRTFFRENDEWPGIVYPAETRYISLLHRAIKLLVADDTTLFNVVISKGGRASIVPEALGLAVVDIFSANFEDLREEYPMHRFSPYFEIVAVTRFRIEREWLHGDLSLLKAQRMAKSLNKRVKALRRRLRDPEVARRYSNFRRGPTENFNGLMECMERLVAEFDKHLIARFDCYYRIAAWKPGVEDLKARLDELGAIQKCRASFHRSLERRLGRALRGSSFCLEYGKDRRWHYHYVMFIDPSFTDDDVDLVESFKKKWLEVTHGQGELFNVNARKRKYRFLAIGFVDTRSEEVLIGLRAIASYMTLAGLFVQIDVARRVKTFWKGRFPALAANAGRPLSRAVNRLRIALATARDQIRFI